VLADLHRYRLAPIALASSTLKQPMAQWEGLPLVQ
jgi:hypothetical protein